MRIGARLALVTLAVVSTFAGGQAAQSPPGATQSALDRAQLLADTATLAGPAFEGRLASSAGGRKARAWVASAFAAIGLEPGGSVGFEQPFSFSIRRLSSLFGAGPFRRDFRDSGNVVGRLDGTLPSLPAVVISAHYDHLGVVGGVVYPGADDNASGVAAMLAVARAMKARGTRRTLIFAAFDAEEEGLRGAKAFVKSRSLERFALNVNLDMVSRSVRREIFVAGTSHTPGLRATVEALQASTPVTIRFGHDRADPVSDDWTLQSDHGAFHEAQIPFLYFGVEDHEDYHKPTDTFDRIDRQFFGDVAALVIDAVAALDATLQ